MFFLRFGVTVFWIENTRLFAIFAQILLVTITVLTIFDQIVATATTASVDFFFDYHDYSLLETFSLSHYEFFVAQILTTLFSLLLFGIIFPGFSAQ